VRYSSEDESRMGLHTIQRRKLTGRGIKPQVQVLWDFIYLWLYGVVEPLTGESFFYEFTHLDTVWGGDKEVYEIDCIRVAARIPC
jgi:hypothetical protein